MTMRLDEGKTCWALVTGASSGIGREFCRQLAAAGMHVVMVARRQPLLDDLAAELARAHSVRSLPISVDLSTPNAASHVKSRLDAERIKVRLLCNNAALGRWGRFESATAEAYEAIVRLNAGSVVSLCWHLLPDLTSHATSAIINVSSQAAYQPVPYMAVYAASKAFVHSFSQALYGEWKERGVLVQTLVPGPTATEFDVNAGAYPSAITKRGSPEDVVKVALAHLGTDKPVVTSIRGTYKQRVFAALAPSKVVIRMVGRMFQPPAES